MPFTLWLAFVATSAVLLVIPGPTILTVISYSMSHGRRTLNASLYAVFAASARRLLASPRAQRSFNLTGGTLLTAAGIWALLAKRPA